MGVGDPVEHEKEGRRGAAGYPGTARRARPPREGARRPGPPGGRRCAPPGRAPVRGTSTSPDVSAGCHLLDVVPDVGGTGRGPRRSTPRAPGRRPAARSSRTAWRPSTCSPPSPRARATADGPPGPPGPRPRSLTGARPAPRAGAAPRPPASACGVLGLHPGRLGLAPGGLGRTTCARPSAPAVRTACPVPAAGAALIGPPVPGRASARRQPAGGHRGSAASSTTAVQAMPSARPNGAEPLSPVRPSPKPEHRAPTSTGSSMS